jgi:hypothetical protein
MQKKNTDKKEKKQAVPLEDPWYFTHIWKEQTSQMDVIQVHVIEKKKAHPKWGAPNRTSECLMQMQRLGKFLKNPCAEPWFYKYVKYKRLSRCL